MSPQDEQCLARAGMEGFAELDKIYGRPRKQSERLSGHHQPHQHHDCRYFHQKNGVLSDHQYYYQKQEPVMASKDAAEYYGGVQYLVYNNKKAPHLVKDHGLCTIYSSKLCMGHLHVTVSCAFYS